MLFLIQSSSCPGLNGHPIILTLTPSLRLLASILILIKRMYQRWGWTKEWLRLSVTVSVFLSSSWKASIILSRGAKLQTRNPSYASYNDCSFQVLVCTTPGTWIRYLFLAGGYPGLSFTTHLSVILHVSIHETSFECLSYCWMLGTLQDSSLVWSLLGGTHSTGGQILFMDHGSLKISPSICLWRISILHVMLTKQL